MDEKWADLVIQEIHTLGQNVSKLDRKIDIKLDKVNERVDDTKTCLTKSLTSHNTVHTSCKQDCTDALESKVSGTFFRWVIGIVIVVLLGIGGLTAGNQVGIERNGVLLEQHIEQNTIIHDDVINKHLEKDHKE